MLRSLFLLGLLAGCQVHVRGADGANEAASTTAADATPARDREDPIARKKAEADFAPAQADIDRADGELASDPAAAERGYLAARRKILSLVAHATYRIARSGSKTEVKGLSALFHRDLIVAQQVPAVHLAESLLWRTMLGRTAALRVLRRDLEIAGEHPLRQSTGEECPEAMRAKCTAHLAMLLAEHPDGFKYSEGQSAGDRGGLYADVILLETGDDLSLLAARLEDRHGKGAVFMRMIPQTSKLAGGTLTLVAKTGDLTYAYGEDCKKYLKTEGGQVRVENGRVAVVERCAKRGTDVMKGKSLVIQVPAAELEGFAVAATPSAREKITFVVDQASLKKSADDRVYTFTRAHVTDRYREGA